ncbi:protein of unknown function [Streptomyces sp. KY75]|nr:protein of unknown function [Streptomyces sp. KY75]CAD5986104.1 protein of unknown function [Streptomyces sp. KY70]
MTAVTTTHPPRSPEQRLRDTLDRLRDEVDAWVATASPDGTPCLVPLSFVWHGGTLLMATRRTNPTAVNVTPTGMIRVTLGPTRDVVLIEGEAEIIEGTDLPPPPGTRSRRSSHGTRGRTPRGCTCASLRTPSGPGGR